MFDDLAFDLNGFREARAERNAYLACAVLLVYEYFLQFGAEVEFFWKQRWSLAKILFLWSRYYSLAFNISNAVVFMQYKPSMELCNTFFHWQNTGASLQVITSHIVLGLRLYAMYGSSRWILGVLVFLTLGEALALGVVFGIPNEKLVGTNQPFRDVFICADADPSDGSHWIVYYWVAVLIIEGILLSLSLYKAWLHRPSSATVGSQLMRRLTRDSVFYFLVIFWIYIANLVIWYKNRITLNELGTPFSFVISNICANRLLISIRSNHYRSVSGEISTYMPSEVQFYKPSGRGQLTTATDTTVGEAYELEEYPIANETRFNHRTGV